MGENTRKSFYIFLTMVLGVLLFLMLQRAAFLVAFLAGVDVGSLSSEALGAVTSVIALVFGAWYGIWLGLTWYAAVYEDKVVRGMFHWLWNSVPQSIQQDESWDIDDLVALADGDGIGSTRLEYFESNTVQFGGEPVSAGSVHAQHIPVSTKKAAPVRKSVRKSTVRKSAV